MPREGMLPVPPSPLHYNAFPHAYLTGPPWLNLASLALVPVFLVELLRLANNHSCVLLSSRELSVYYRVTTAKQTLATVSVTLTDPYLSGMSPPASSGPSSSSSSGCSSSHWTTSSPSSCCCCWAAAPASPCSPSTPSVSDQPRACRCWLSRTRSSRL